MRTLTEQAEAVAAGAVSVVSLVEEALEGIERTQPQLNAFTHVLAEDALTRARALEGSEPTGPLHGVPVAVKELYDVEGFPTTGCCAAYADRIAVSDSAVVAKLRSAGAIVVAKTNQHELACGATTLVSSFGPCRNPWDIERITGGSSGGSGAAVGAGVVAMAMGSDTGGSIRIPSSFCGVTGLKPTHGSVSLRGAMPMSPSLDTAGPLARSADDCMLVHQLLAGVDPAYLWSRRGVQRDPSPSPEGVRIAIPGSFMKLVHPETKAAVLGAAQILTSLGAQVSHIDGPDPDEALRAFSLLAIPQVSHCFRDLWDDPRVSPDIAGFISFGRQINAADAFGGEEIAQKVRRDFAAAFESADALLVPGAPYPAPTAEASQVDVEGGTLDVHTGGPARFTIPANVAGLPSVAFPVGFSEKGLPLGAQLIGPAWSELAICSVVAAYQHATDWHLRAAPVS